MRERRAFTLVELLVVITIIAMLAGLGTAAAMRVRVSARQAVITMEVNQLDMAIQAFKTRFGAYPPDFANTDRAAAVKEVQRFIAQAFPRCTVMPADFQAVQLSASVNASTALVYWLGGVVDANGNRIGFSADPTNPFDVDLTGQPLATKSPSRIAPFFEFDKERVKPSPTSAYGYVYWPAGCTIDVTNQQGGYIYFRAENSDYSAKGWPTALLGATRDKSSTATNIVWLNPASFQLRCCGLDGKWFDPVGAKNKWGQTLGGSDILPENYDDMGNCWSGTLGDSM